MAETRRESQMSSNDKSRIHTEFEAYLARLGLRQTKQRRVILDAVMALGPHVDADTIAAQAKRMDRSIGLATVYRALQLMTDSGLLVERQFGKERTRFEFADGPTRTHHDHLICRQCGAIVEFLDEEIERLQEEAAKRLGFNLVQHRMELFADCVNPESCDRAPGRKTTSRNHR